MNAPIALFAYNRPLHLSRTIQALQNNLLANDSQLIVFSDGPKNEFDKEAIIEVRSYVRTIKGFKKVTLIESSTNNGLANSIIAGVSDVVDRYGEVIVIEDDLITSKFFLTYMNKALKKFEFEDDVASIHGYIYPVDGLPDSFFLKGADCWGWATWKRAWEIFEKDGEKLYNKLLEKGLSHEFDFFGTQQYTKMLRDQFQSKNDSWAIRWYASCFLQGKYTLYPGKSLVRNIGFDGTGTHGNPNDSYASQKIFNGTLKLDQISIKEDIESKKMISKWFSSKLTWKKKIIRFLGGLRKRIFMNLVD